MFDGLIVEFLSGVIGSLNGTVMVGMNGRERLWVKRVREMVMGGIRKARCAKKDLYQLGKKASTRGQKSAE